MSQQTKNSVIEAGAKFLSDPKILGRLPNDIQNGVANGSKEFAYAEYYFKKRFTAITGIIDFIKETDTLTAGERNFDKGKLPTGVYMALTSVSFNYAFHATSGGVGIEPGSQIFMNSAYTQAVHTCVRNSEFTLKNGNRTVLECMTKTFLSDSSISYQGANANDEAGLVLPQPKLLLPESQIRAYFQFPTSTLTATTDATNNHFGEIILKGVKIVDRVEK